MSRGDLDRLMLDPKDHDVWVPYFTIEEVSEMGQEWPSVLVNKWEENYRGERRFVGSKVYEPPVE